MSAPDRRALVDRDHGEAVDPAAVRAPELRARASTGRRGRRTTTSSR